MYVFFMQVIVIEALHADLTLFLLWQSCHKLILYLNIDLFN
jgi:hypothetical protein